MKKILLLQTGGTIAMDINPEGQPQLDEDAWSTLIDRKVPELNDIATINVTAPFFEDSSDVGPQQWGQLIECISANYDSYDSFVILHGTDTMAYTASALSFGLQQLSKPVILTGSQVPMATLRSDARRNLINAIEMATLPLPEVAVCFNDRVFRGNRTTKVSISDFHAFESPNHPPLAKIGLNIILNSHRPPANRPLKAAPVFSDEVFLLKLYPGLSPQLLQQLPLSSIKVLIIEAFGSGNFAIKNHANLLPFFENCRQAGILLVFTSQAPYDAVDLQKYESGRAIARQGALSAGDMTTEATLTKMMYLLANCSSDDELKSRFQTNIAGERSP